MINDAISNWQLARFIVHQNMFRVIILCYLHGLGKFGFENTRATLKVIEIAVTFYFQNKMAS